MSLEEVKALLKKIKVYYQNFTVNEEVIGEWSRVLKNYDYDDLLRKLDQHLQGERADDIPKLNYLIKYLDTIDLKEKSKSDAIVFCNLCGKKMTLTDYNNHYGRCLQVQTLWRKSKSLGKEIPREEIEQFGDDILDKLEEKYIGEATGIFTKI